MKALVLHGKNGDYRYEPDWEEPAVPEGSVLIKVAYSGICGSDIPRFAISGSYRHPVILGHEFSGTLVETGKPVAVLPIMPCGVCEPCAEGKGPFHCRKYRFIGSRDDGGFAEYCAVPEKNLLRFPSEELLKAGSLTEPMVVGLHAVRRSGFIPGKAAVVFGSGPIGLTVGIWLKEFGAGRIIMTDIRKMNLEIAEKAGFETADLTKCAAGELGSADYAFEAAGSANAFNNAVKILNPMGTLTVVGRDTRDTVIPVTVFESLMRKEVQLHGCWGYDMRGENDFLVKTLERNRSILEGFITNEISIENAHSFVKRMCDREIEYCKAVIRF